MNSLADALKALPAKPEVSVSIAGEPQAADFSGPPPPVEWVAEGLVQVGSLHKVDGIQGSGKGWFIASLARACLVGQPMMGRFKVPLKRPVLLIDNDTPTPRLNQVLHSLGIAAHPDLTVWSQQPADLAKDATHKAIARWVEAHPGGVVILDSLRALTPDRNLNKDEEVEPVMTRLSRLLAEGKTTVVLTHHAALDRAEDDDPNRVGRNSSAINAKADAVIALYKGGIVRTFSKRTHPLVPGFVFEVKGTVPEPVSVAFVREMSTNDPHKEKYVSAIMVWFDDPARESRAMGFDEVRGKMAGAMGDKALRSLLREMVDSGTLSQGTAGHGKFVFWVKGSAPWEE